MGDAITILPILAAVLIPIKIFLEKKPRLFEIIDSCFFKKNGTLLLAEIFLYSHEAEFTQKQETNKIFAVAFNSAFR